MSPAELFIMFYNGLFFKKTKELIHRYDFLENLTKDDLLNPDKDAMLYSTYRTGSQEILPTVEFKSRDEILKL